MAKQKNKNKNKAIIGVTNTEEDDLLLEAFKLIKFGLENGDWYSVSQGYESITGEKIVPPEFENKPLMSKLDKLKLGLNIGKLKNSIVAKKNGKQTFADRVKKSYNSEAVIIEVKGGKTDKQLANLDKMSEAAIPEGWPDQRVIVTSPQDAKEKKANEKAARKVIKIKPQRRTVSVETEPELKENDNRGVRYISDVTKIHRSRD